MASLSTIASISYFLCYILFMVILAIYVYHDQKHDLNKTFVKSVWQQRKIYGQIIVHFYDTATDIGVLIAWYQLYMDEKHGINYISIDMAVFFWGGCSVLTLYRIFNVVLTIYDTTHNSDKYSSWREYKMTQIIMWFGLITAAVLDLFIFFTVYDSFQSAETVIAENKDRSARIEKKKNRKVSDKTEKSPQVIEVNLDPVEGLEVIDIEPAWTQFVCMLAESVIESMPQIVLQSVFLIRSANDTSGKLSSNNNLSLIVMSLIASILSISNKFYKLDKGGVIKKAKSLKPKLQYPNCIQPWYLVRIVWRFAHIACRFIIFSLSWIVLGGAFMSMYIGLTICFYICSLSILSKLSLIDHENDGFIMVLFGGFLGTVGMPIYSQSCIIMIPKWLDSMIMLIIITIFANTDWNCIICALSETRQMSKNSAILSFIIMGYISWTLDVVLFIILSIFEIISESTQLEVGVNDIDRYTVHRDIILGYLQQEDDVETFWKRFCGDSDTLDRKQFDDILYVSLQLFCVVRDPDLELVTRDAVNPFIEKLRNELAPRVDTTGSGVIDFEEFQTFVIYLDKEWGKLKQEKSAK